jgi:galactokinase
MYEVWSHNPRYDLKKRACHVLSEAVRLQNLQTPVTGEVLGIIMTESNESATDNYESDSTETNELSALCLQKGAAGAKVVGEGWGGCVLALVEDGNVNSLIANVYDYYTKDRGEE